MILSNGRSTHADAAHKGQTAIALTTAQKRFLAHTPPPERWVIPFRFETSAGCRIQADRLKSAMAHVVDHHPVLRSYFFKTAGDEWAVDVVSAGNNVALFRDDLSALSEAEQLDRLERSWNEFELGFDLLHGPHLKAALHELGGRQSLSIFMNHLVVDAYSAFLVLDDLQQAYAAIANDGEPRTPDVSVSLRTIVQNTIEATREKERQGEVEYWRSLPWHRAKPVPPDFPSDTADNTFASTRGVHKTLSAEKTSWLQKLPRAVLGMGINDGLLMALTDVITRLTGEPCIQVIAVDGRGQTLYTPEDTSETTGWISQWRRLVVERSPAVDPVDRLRSFAEQLATIPDGGLGFEMLLWNSASEHTRKRLYPLARNDTMLNFLGDMDAVKPKTSIFGDLKASARPKSDETLTLPEKHRPLHPDSHTSTREVPLLVTAYIKERRLNVRWEYSCNLHAYETINRLAGRFVDELAFIADTVETCL